jgi:hypothetical protein
MNWYTIFYWITVADNVKTFFEMASIFFSVGAGIFLAGGIVTIFTSENFKNEETKRWLRNFKKMFYYFCTLAVFSWLGYIFIPSKRDALLIVAGGAVGTFVTSDTSSRQIPAELTRYIHKALQKETESLSEDEKKDIPIKTTRESFLDQAEKLTKEQIIEYLKKDTTILR